MAALNVKSLSNLIETSPRMIDPDEASSNEVRKRRTGQPLFLTQTGE